MITHYAIYNEKAEEATGVSCGFSRNNPEDLTPEEQILQNIEDDLIFGG